jgi:hypothetical protein
VGVNDISEAEAEEVLAEVYELVKPVCPTATCRYCGHPIICLGGVWRHDIGPGTMVPSGYGTIGCRSATFDRDGAWDETMNRAWKAKPRA